MAENSVTKNVFKYLLQSEEIFYIGVKIKLEISKGNSLACLVMDDWFLIWHLGAIGLENLKCDRFNNIDKFVIIQKL